jgi:NAD(P)-dependent dehydrogenase (short-subunit alcohol dehydrogenase family)
MGGNNMKDKVVLITGATDGIGEQAARELAAMGARVVIAGRSVDRCRESVAAVRDFSGSEKVDYLVADLSSMGEVARLAEEFLRRYDRLDVLMNNAGSSFLERTLSEDGFEKTFALNHLAYFLLTNLLLDILKQSSPSRIVNTSSNSSFRGKIHFDDLHLKRFYFVHQAYAQSKLANIMFAKALSRRLEGTGVTANAFHPGLVRTGIFRKVRIVGPLIDWLLSRRAISVQDGAETMVYLASSPEVVGVSGEYFYKKEPQQTNPLSYIVEDQERLWMTSQEMVRPWLMG